VLLETWQTTTTTEVIRCSRPLCSSQDTGGNGPSSARPRWPEPFLSEVGTIARFLRTQQRVRKPRPRAVPVPLPRERGSVLTRQLRARQPNNQCSTRKHGHPDRHSLPQAPVLLRKEVIQPHLPVRLPCYDFVPIADPTFDGSLPYGLGRRLRVLPTFVT
jgi:hypothetical protein